MDIFTRLPLEIAECCLSYDNRFQKMNAFKNLPIDLVKHCLSYDRRCVIKKESIIFINRLHYNDPRYSVLKQRPNIEYDRKPVIENVYASYLDGKKLLQNRFTFSFAQVYNHTIKKIVFFIRKIDSRDGCEIWVSRYTRI